jgi:SSS family solute:Na+ symporter
MFSIVVPPVAVLFLIGVFFKRAGGKAAFYTLVVGTAWSITTFLLAQFGYWNVHYTINVGITFAVSALVFVITSYRTAPPAPESVEKYTYSPALLAPTRSDLVWYQDYRISAVGLVLVMLAILVVFW